MNAAVLGAADVVVAAAAASCTAVAAYQRGALVNVHWYWVGGIDAHNARVNF